MLMSALQSFTLIPKMTDFLYRWYFTDLFFRSEEEGLDRMVFLITYCKNFLSCCTKMVPTNFDYYNTLMF